MNTQTTGSGASTTPTAAASEGFESTFGERPAFVATAPGRVNLIGEHTDYNDGFVFPAALEFHTAVAIASRPDRLLDVVAIDESNQRVQFPIDDAPQLDEQAPWSNYVRGVVHELRQAGYELQGANIAISGNVPLGAGLSSSAALEMALIAALTTLSNEPIDAASAAKLGQAAENNFVGCQCGIMDQMISASGKAGHAMMLDCRDLSLRAAPLPSSLALVVINSNVRRALVDGEYNQRREQCETAANHFGVAALRDLTLESLNQSEAELDATVFRRARHVITENQRTLEMVDALANGDVPEISRLMAASHASMREDFEITIPEIDALVDIVAEVVGINGGVRMTGGGFGGCIVALLPHDQLENVLQAIATQYPSIAGHTATAFVCTTSDGAFVAPTP